MLLKLKRSKLPLFVMLGLSIVIGGCQTPDLTKEWPNDLPDRNLFVDTYNEQVAAGTNNESLERHLLWIKRFYHGSIIYPVGWNDMIEAVSESLNTEKSKAQARQRLQDLGVQIVIEWAQDNSIRKISSSNIATWGNALRTSVERGEQFDFIDIVERDVEMLINGALSMREISRDRYYPPEDYDNF